jgi:molybdopterin/thiamine biosynthesis adenylyltransferase/rhodanese-related sulfurtransferase
VTDSYHEMVARAKQVITEVEPADIAERLDELVLLDTREPYEHAEGAITGSHLVPRGVLERNIGTVVPDLDSEIVAYCAVGNRSALAAISLEQMGYRNVSSLTGGFERWRRETRPASKPSSLSVDERARYSRHLLLPEVGEEGQAKLLASSIVIVGAGGLGSSAALYLAAAGIGRIGLVDWDVVEASNLQRQILHTTEAVGTPKVESGARTLAALNPDIRVDQVQDRLGAGNILDLLAEYDVIIDAADNFPTRYLINDAALNLGIPVVHGSILRFEGQAAVFTPYAGPCYRCLFPAPPPPELAPSCADAGVLGAMAGIIGSIQAMEAVKLIVGAGDPLVGRLLTYDALGQEMLTFGVPRDPECPACGGDRTPQIIEYDDRCQPATTG